VRREEATGSRCSFHVTEQPAGCRGGDAHLRHEADHLFGPARVHVLVVRALEVLVVELALYELVESLGAADLPRPRQEAMGRNEESVATYI